MKKQTVYNNFIAVLFQYWKTIVWLAIVFFLSTMKVSDMPKVSLINIPHFDKIIHFLMYFILATIWLIDDYKQRTNFQLRKLVVVFISSAIYGISMELIQKLLVQERSGDLLDALANTFGLIVAFLLFINIYFYRTLLVKIFSIGYKEKT